MTDTFVFCLAKWQVVWTAGPTPASSESLLDSRSHNNREEVKKERPSVVAAGSGRAHCERAVRRAGEWGTGASARLHRLYSPSRAVIRGGGKGLLQKLELYLYISTSRYGSS